MSNTQLPAEIKEAIIKAAADLSGRDPGELDALEAIYILQETGDEEPQGDLYRQLTKEAAGELFGDPKHVEEWEEVAAEWDGDAPELFALTLQRDLDPIIKEKARKLRGDLPQDDSRREELDAILAPPKISLSPELKAQINELYAIQNGIAKNVIGPMIELVNETVRAAMEPSRMLAERLFPVWDDLRESITEFLENNPAFLLYDEITGDLEPYILEELKKPQYEGKTIADLWDEAEEAAEKAEEAAGETEGGFFADDNLLMQAVKAARAAADKEKGAEETQPAAAELPKAPEHKPVAEMDFTTDKMPYIFFGGSLPLPQKDVPGQLSFTPIKEKYSSGEESESFIYWHYFINEETFEKLGLAKEYDYEDYFILCVLFTERMLGNTVVSPSALYRDVYGDRPNDKQLEEFRKRLYKLDATRIYINNHDLMKTWKGADPDATYTEGVFHLINIDFKIERYLYNGKVANESIIIGEVPALLKIGADIKHMTKIPKSAFYVTDQNGRKIKKTPRYWHALIYLTRRVAQMKNGKGETKILYETLYNEMHATKAREKQLTRDAVYKILEHWRRVGWIKAYKEETTKTTGKVGVKIILPASAIPAKKRKRITRKKEGAAAKK